MRLVYDTETTGLALFNKPSDDPSQPHIVQFAALLLDDDWTERACVNLIVRPDGWAIPDDVAKIHGITTDIATRCGVPEEYVVEIFMWLTASRDTVQIAHNISFDRRIMRIAKLRAGQLREHIEGDEAKPSFCTMKATQPLCELPLTEKQIARGITGFKQPKLSEAYMHFFAESLEGAHDALVDVRACARIYRHLHDNNLI